MKKYTYQEPEEGGTQKVAFQTEQGPSVDQNHQVPSQGPLVAVKVRETSQGPLVAGKLRELCQGPLIAGKLRETFQDPLVVAGKLQVPCQDPLVAGKLRGFALEEQKVLQMEKNSVNWRKLLAQREENCQLEGMPASNNRSRETTGSNVQQIAR